MKLLLKLISFIGLILTVVPAFLVFAGTIELQMHKNLMLMGTLLWFIPAPFWMSRKS
jgi:high-affinity Fe2+/Pb2+ permease